MLQSYGLLSEDSRLQSSRPILHDTCVEGLVIDDYFVVSKEQLLEKESFLESQSVPRFHLANAA